MRLRGLGELLPPVPVTVLVVVAAASALPWLRVLDEWGPSLAADDRTRGLLTSAKELVQFAEVWLVAFLVFRGVGRDARFRRWLVPVLAVVALALWGSALAEYVAAVSGRSLRGLADVGEIDGLFGLRYNPSFLQVLGSESSKNVLGLALAVLAPLLLGAAWGQPQMWARWLLAALALVLLTGILHLGLLIAALAGCVLVAALAQRRYAVPAVLLTALLVLGAAVSWRGSQHGPILLDSVALCRQEDRFGLLPMPMKGISQTTGRADWSPWQQKYEEWQAALNGISFSPLLGHGLGSYQARINPFYARGQLETLWIEKLPRNLMEKDAHSVYFVFGVETGVLGLLALCWVLVWGVQSALRARARTALAADRWLMCGVAGALVALLLAGVFTSFLVRGVALLAMLLLALPTATEPEAGEA